MPAFACGASTSYSLIDDKPICLLAATSASSREAHVPHLVESLSELCATFNWVHAILNFFDDVPLLGRAASRHARVSVTSVPGFKVLFWKRELRRSRYAHFSHVWLVDSDMAIAPSEFDLQLLLRVMNGINASIVQPSPYGGGAGLYSYTAIRGANRATGVCGDRTSSGKLPNGRGQSFDEKCVACRVPVVEVKVPLFTSTAWGVIHSLVLSPIDDRSLTSDVGLDLVWCSLVEKHIGSGCSMKQASDDWHAAKKLYPNNPEKWCHNNPDSPQCTVPGCGQACAVVYATPVKHYNYRSIHAVLAHSNGSSRAFPMAAAAHFFGEGGGSGGSGGSGRGGGGSSTIGNPLGGGKFEQKAIYVKLMNMHGVHKMFPTWRPPNTLLRAQPCFSSVGPLRHALALSNWSATTARALRLDLAATDELEGAKLRIAQNASTAKDRCLVVKSAEERQRCTSSVAEQLKPAKKVPPHTDWQQRQKTVQVGHKHSGSGSLALPAHANAARAQLNAKQQAAAAEQHARSKPPFERTKAAERAHANG